MGDLSHYNNHITAIVDWLILRLTTAHRVNEWCQPTNPEGFKNKKLQGLQLYKQEVEHTKKKVYAKYTKDWQSFDKHQKIITNPFKVKEEGIAYTSNWYHYQKDLKKNDITILYKLIHKEPAQCLTRAKLQIL